MDENEKCLRFLSSLSLLRAARGAARCSLHGGATFWFTLACSAPLPFVVQRGRRRWRVRLLPELELSQKGGEVVNGDDVGATPASEMRWCESDRARRKAMKITYFVSAGTGDATRASIPLHLAANGSVEVGQETSIVFGGDATELLLGDNADRMEGVGVPPARELLAKLRDHEVPVFV